jgi:hypothetical protein
MGTLSNIDGNIVNERLEGADSRLSGAPMKKSVLVVVAAAVACGASVLWAQGGGGAAQSSTPPQRNWYSVTLTTVKPGTGAQWQEITKSQTIPMQQKGGIKSRDTWQSGAPFGEGNMFGVVTPIDKFATYDMPPMAVRILGQAAANAYNDKLAALTVSRRTFAVQDRAELSMPPAAGAKFVGAILADVTIVSGHQAQYEAYIKDDLLPLLKRDKALGFVLSRTVFGGNANEYHEVTYLSSFADIDKGPAQARLLNPAERTAMAAKRTPHIEHIEQTILRYVPDLSYAPKPGS